MVEVPVTYGFTLHDFGDVFGTAIIHFLVGSHNFMITALGSCVKWPLEPIYTVDHEVGPWKMVALFPWFGFIVQLSRFDFFRTSIYNAFGPLTRYKPNVDQEE